jgi:hypothetical protein
MITSLLTRATILSVTSPRRSNGERRNTATPRQRNTFLFITLLIVGEYGNISNDLHQQILRFLQHPLPPFFGGGKLQPLVRGKFPPAFSPAHGRDQPAGVYGGSGVKGEDDLSVVDRLTPPASTEASGS